MTNGCIALTSTVVSAKNVGHLDMETEYLSKLLQLADKKGGVYSDR